MSRTSVKKQFERLQQSKQDLLNRLAAADDAVLRFRPHSQKWTILQIIDHLNYSESIGINYINKKSQGGRSVPKAGPFSFLRSFLLTIALRFMKWKKPAVIPDPPDTIDAKELWTAWEQSRMQLDQLLRQLPDDMFDRNIFRHPVAGRMNLSQALAFMQEHFNHHLRQINERLAAAMKNQ